MHSVLINYYNHGKKLQFRKYNLCYAWLNIPVKEIPEVNHHNTNKHFPSGINELFRHNYPV